jgi:GNAT superfamily N-acetyltransferase
MVKIRPATAEDAAGIARVHTQVWREAYQDLLPPDLLARRVITEDTWLTRILQPAPRSSIHVALDDSGDVVGFAAAGPATGPTSAEDESVGQLYAIYVVASCWGTGIGYRLHLAAMDELRAAGFSEARLWVLPGNVRAIAFYESQGWSDRGVDTDEEFEGYPVRERLHGRRL